MKLHYLYHGTLTGPEELVPDLKLCDENSDFGQAFYLTENEPQACRWAVRYGCDGYVHKYECDFSGLKILNFLNFKDNNLAWLATLIRSRLNVPELPEEAVWLAQALSVKLSDYDIVIGRLGDDQISGILESFCMGDLPLHGAVTALGEGKLKPQVAVRTDAGLQRLQWDGSAIASFQVYGRQKRLQSNSAIAAYHNLLRYFTREKNDMQARASMHFLYDIYKMHRDDVSKLRSIYSEVSFNKMPSNSEEEVGHGPEQTL